MTDPRLAKLARVLVRHCVAVKPGQTVRITGDVIGLPLLELIHEEVVRAGGHPLVRMSSQNMQDAMLELGGEDQLRHLPELLLAEVDAVDASIGLWADVNTKAQSQADPARQALRSAAGAPLSERFLKRAADGELRWCGTQFPTNAAAQDAEMSLRAYADFVFTAGHLNAEDPAAEWERISAKQQRVVDYLTGKQHLHFTAPNGTDLRVDVSGNTWINCDGHENFPDGEVFTGPNLGAGPDSPAPGGVQGVVRYSFPAVHGGREVHGIELVFDGGRVVEAKARKNQDFLVAMLDQDEGARRLGEIAIGTNHQITRYTKNTLFDEKIGGTFHAAVGAGYPETGNANRSGLHWDMVCDLRESAPGAADGGRITADGELFHEHGKFVGPLAGVFG